MSFNFGKKRSNVVPSCPCTRSFSVPDGVDWNEQSRALSQAAYYAANGLVKSDQLPAIAAGETVKVTINRPSEARFVDVMYADAMGNFFPVDEQEADGFSLVVVELTGNNRPVVKGELKDRKLADATLEVYDQLAQLRFDWLNSEGIFAPGYVPPATEQALPAPVPTNGQQAPAASTSAGPTPQAPTAVTTVSEKLEDGSLRLTITIPGYNPGDRIAKYLGFCGHKAPSGDEIRQALATTGKHYAPGVEAECRDAVEAGKRHLQKMENELKKAIDGRLDGMRRELSGAEKSLEMVSKIAAEIKAEDNREKKAIKAIMDCLNCDEEAAKRILKQQPAPASPAPVPANPAPAAPQPQANPAPANPIPVPQANPAPANPAPAAPQAPANPAPAPQVNPAPANPAPAPARTIYSCTAVTELAAAGVKAEDVPPELVDACSRFDNVSVDMLNFWLKMHRTTGSSGQIVQL